MIKREITKFDLVTAEGRYPASVPFSVAEILEQNKLSQRSVRGGVSLECEIISPDPSLATKHFYLRLVGINHPADILVSGRRVGSLDGTAPVVNIDLDGCLEGGSNILTIRFTETDEQSLLHAGVSMPAKILRFSSAIIDRVSFSQLHEGGEVNIDISLETIGNSSAVRAVATLVSATGQIYYGGLTGGKGRITVKDPLYWWPRGFGVQNLYRLSVSLWGENDVEDSVEMKIGLRSLSDSIARDDSLMVGELRILPMGATYVPDDHPDPAYLDMRAEAAVSAAAEVGYNCLVLPLDAPIPSEKFYDACDRAGIMIIEEHREPTEGELLRLGARASHPSLVMVDLIGVDEPEELRAMLLKSLPGILIRTRESAPSYISAPSIPSHKSIRRDIPEGERTLFSRSIEGISEEGAIRDMLLAVAEKYPYPPDFASFSYASALAAANKVGALIRDARLGEGKAGRAVFSRLSDSELKISSSAIDHRGRWKPLQYYSKRFFAPVRLYAVANSSDVRFYAVNGKKSLLSAVMEYKILDRDNRVIYDGARQVELSAMSADSLFTIDFSEYVEGHESEYCLEYCLKEGTTLLSRDVLLFVPEKHFDFKKPNIKSVITGEGNSFSITLAADCFVKDLEIDFDGVDVRLSDNYIDLTSDAPVRVEFTVLDSAYNTQNLKDALLLRSVSDLR